jgi:hypothetical protein
MKKRYEKQWSRLDNAARIYPALSSETASRVFRLYCQLNDPVQPEALQRAADRALEAYPEFTNTIRTGFFWYYREQSDLRAVVHEEKESPCQRLYSPNVHGLLVDVSYFRNRINLEIFHGLADGLGAAVLFQTLVLFYLEEAYPALQGCAQRALGELKPTERDGDAFQRYKGKYQGGDMSALLGKRDGRVYHFHGHRMPDRRQLVTEICVSSQKVRQAAKAYDATVTAFLSALLLLSIRETMPVRKRTQRICLSEPVNLRGHFASDTLRNFFSIIEICYNPAASSGELDAVIQEVKQAMQSELTEEKLGGKITQQAKLGSSVTIRAVPLLLKNPVIFLSKKLSERNSTMVFSNVGQMKLPEEVTDYVEQCGAYLSSATRQLVTCSYGDRMVLSFAGTLVEKDVERAMLRRLSQYDDSISVTTNYGQEVWQIK